VGCIFAEIIVHDPFFKGENPQHQLEVIVSKIGKMMIMMIMMIMMMLIIVDDDYNNIRITFKGSITIY